MLTVTQCPALIAEFGRDPSTQNLTLARISYIPQPTAAYLAECMVAGVQSGHHVEVYRIDPGMPEPLVPGGSMTPNDENWFGSQPQKPGILLLAALLEMRSLISEHVAI